MADTQKLVILGAVGIGAYMFRDQISSWLGLAPASGVNPVAAAQSAAATAAASGATPTQQAVVAQQAATAAASVQIAQGPQPVSASTDIGVNTPGPNTLLAKAAGGDMQTALSLASDPRAQLNLYQWNWYRLQWNPAANTLDASAKGLDADSPVNAPTYLRYLAQ